MLIKDETLKSVLFDPEKGFLRLYVVWIPVGIIFTVAVAASVLIMLSTPLVLDTSSSGFNYFVSTFRFPLGTLTLIIPILALLATNHRSEQTREQIKVTGVQNNFANYYKHLEEFIKFVSKLDGNNNEAREYIENRDRHRFLYPESQSGNYRLSQSLLFNWESANLLTKELLDNYPTDYKMSINDQDFNRYFTKIASLSFHPSGMHDSYRKEVFLNGTKLGFDGRDERTYLHQSIMLIRGLIEATDILDRLCKFSVEYESLLDIRLKEKFTINAFRNHSPVNLGVDTNYIDPKLSQTFEEANINFKSFLANYSNGS